MFLIFISLSWISDAHAFEGNQSNCGVTHNPARTAAIIGGACGSPVYVNFKTKKTYSIIKEQYRNFYIKWLDNRVATLEAGCGTGCVEAYIFVAPTTVVSCADHEYRIHFLDPKEPPDYSSNRPLLVDPKKRIYVCYDGDNNIQIFPLPNQPTIRPPEGFFSEKAEIHNEKLTVIYKNAHGKIKRINHTLSTA
ncbi:hypothetical protein AYO45_01450 [Gammaproteobacteria bacterium SCGC AG-212-F23]|nr:hypothetical protein AYO45_01450 [Gammaproteobacteria bacterium SCGC AG-212-F23]